MHKRSKYIAIILINILLLNGCAWINKNILNKQADENSISNSDTPSEDTKAADSITSNDENDSALPPVVEEDLIIDDSSKDTTIDTATETSIVANKADTEITEKAAPPEPSNLTIADIIEINSKTADSDKPDQETQESKETVEAVQTDDKTIIPEDKPSDKTADNTNATEDKTADLTSDTKKEPADTKKEPAGSEFSVAPKDTPLSGPEPEKTTEKVQESPVKADQEETPEPEFLALTGDAPMVGPMPMTETKPIDAPDKPSDRPEDKTEATLPDAATEEAVFSALADDAPFVGPMPTENTDTVEKNADDTKTESLTSAPTDASENTDGPESPKNTDTPTDNRLKTIAESIASTPDLSDKNPETPGGTQKNTPEKTSDSTPDKTEDNIMETSKEISDITDKATADVNIADPLETDYTKLPEAKVHDSSTDQTQIATTESQSDIITTVEKTAINKNDLKTVTPADDSKLMPHIEIKDSAPQKIESVIKVNKNNSQTATKELTKQEHFLHKKIAILNIQLNEQRERCNKLEDALTKSQDNCRELSSNLHKQALLLRISKLKENSSPHESKYNTVLSKQDNKIASQPDADNNITIKKLELQNQFLSLSESEKIRTLRSELKSLKERNRDLVVQIMKAKSKKTEIAIARPDTTHMTKAITTDASAKKIDTTHLPSGSGVSSFQGVADNNYKKTEPVSTAGNISGKIQNIQGRTIYINMGSKAGVRNGMKFIVYRNATFVGYIKVSRVLRDQSTAIFTRRIHPAEIGDLVVDKL